MAIALVNPMITTSTTAICKVNKKNRHGLDSAALRTLMCHVRLTRDFFPCATNNIRLADTSEIIKRGYLGQLGGDDETNLRVFYTHAQSSKYLLFSIMHWLRQR